MRPNRIETVPAVTAALAGVAILALAATSGASERVSQPRVGAFLVAERSLEDPNFTETVVLLLRYDAGGAMGLVVNRPSGSRLSSVLPDVEGTERVEVYLGGPIARDSFQLLVQSDDDVDRAQRVFDDVHSSSDGSVLKRLVRVPTSRFRIYAGHAGWGPGQLEREIGRGDWHLTHASAREIFEYDADRLWRHLLPADPRLTASFRAPRGEPRH